MQIGRNGGCWYHATFAAGAQFEGDRNRASTSPRATSCRARSVFCLVPAGDHFRHSSPSYPLLALPGEYGSALTILPSRAPPRLHRGVIYAAAFHIFHCFQVFGSICKIKFVMREHTPRACPTLPPVHRSTPPICASRRHPPSHPPPVPSPPFAARTRVDAYGRPTNFLAWKHQHRECSKRILACEEASPAARCWNLVRNPAARLSDLDRKRICPNRVKCSLVH